MCEWLNDFSWLCAESCDRIVAFFWRDWETEQLLLLQQSNKSSDCWVRCTVCLITWLFSEIQNISTVLISSWCCSLLFGGNIVWIFTKLGQRRWQMNQWSFFEFFPIEKTQFCKLVWFYQNTYHNSQNHTPKLQNTSYILQSEALLPKWRIALSESNFCTSTSFILQILV